MTSEPFRDWSRIAFLHPGWLTLIFLGSFLIFFGKPAGVIAVAAYVFLFVWLWAVYRTSRLAAGLLPTRLSQFLFPAAVVVFGGFWLAAAIGQRFVDIGGLLGALLSIPLMALFLGPFWVAAKALEQTLNSMPPTFGRVLGTALLLAYYPVGVWILRPKLRQVRALLSPEMERAGPLTRAGPTPNDG